MIWFVFRRVLFGDKEPRDVSQFWEWSQGAVQGIEEGGGTFEVAQMTYSGSDAMACAAVC